MAGEGFLLNELIVWVSILGIALAVYTLLLLLSLHVQRQERLQKLLVFLQKTSLSLVPIVVLMTLERPGLSNESAVRLLEEIALNVIRYQNFIRPAVGYLGAWIDIVVLFALLSPAGRIAPGKVHKWGKRRAATDPHIFWMTIIRQDYGPVSHWRISGRRIYRIRTSRFLGIRFDFDSIVDYLAAASTEDQNFDDSADLSHQLFMTPAPAARRYNASRQSASVPTTFLQSRLPLPKSMERLTASVPTINLRSGIAPTVPMKKPILPRTTTERYRL